MVHRKIKEQVIKKFERQKSLNKLYAKEGPHELIMVLDGLKPDFNIGKIYRSAEAMGVKSIFLVGVDFFDPYPARGCFRKLKTEFFEDFSQCFERLKELDYQCFVFDSQEGANMHEVKFPTKSAFLVGHEEFGHSFNINDYQNMNLIKIKQFGDVESMNVAVAASLSMYEYVRQHILV